MAIPCLEGDLCQPFQGVAFLSVVLHSILSGMVFMAQINRETVLLRQLSVRSASENMVTLQISHPAADKASLAFLHDAFSHLAMILASSSLDTGIGSPMLIMSCFR